MNQQHARLLATVQRKLDIDLECARAALARLRGQERTHADDLQQVRIACSEHEAHAAMRARDRLDTATHAQALKHLMHLRTDLARRERDAKLLHDHVAQAASECVAQDRKVACVRELRDAIEQRQALQAQRRAAAESDRAWLVRWAVSSQAPGVMGARE